MEVQFTEAIERPQHLGLLRLAGVSGCAWRGRCAVVAGVGVSAGRVAQSAHAARTIGLLTALYGLGQIVGPPLASVRLHRSVHARGGFTASLQIAATAVVTGALLFLWLSRAFPKR
jgi:Uncharacterised MFS-type transporter YbfB